jgi:transposase
MQIYIGIDWSKEKHDAVFVNEAGAKMAHLSFTHSPQGFEKFDQTRAQFGAAKDCLLALETAHNLLVDFLWARNYTQVYVVPPSLVKGSRKRYRQSGARTDESDAELLGNLLRTDHHRLHPWHPDRGLTRQMRAQISLYLYLSRSCVRLGNRLRSVLLRYYPAALEIFYHLDAHITLEFIRAFPTPQKAAELDLEGFQAFARQHRYPRPGQLVRRFAKLQATRISAAPATVLAYQSEAVTLATLFLETTKAKLGVSSE